MDSDILVFIFLIIGCATIFVAQMINDNKKEIELIKNTKEYVIYQNCEYFDEEYYCYE